MNTGKFDFIQKNSFLIGIGASCIAGFLFALTPIWQLAFVAGFLGGILNTNQKKGSLSGMIGMVLAWGLSIGYYSVLNRTYILFNQLGVLIFNQVGMGWTLILVVLLVGGATGALGGFIGAGVHILVWTSKESKDILIPNEPLEK